MPHRNVRTVTSTRQAARAARVQQREQDRQLAARRGDPLPPGVFLVEVADRVAALRVLGPGSAELATAGAAPTPLAVRAVRSVWLWRRRTRLFCLDGKRIVFPLAPGEYGLAELGRSTSPEYSLLDISDGLG